jgi:hypothetical protein
MATIFDKARRWAKNNFKRLEGQPYEADFLASECRRLLSEYPGISLKKWLFVYSPESVSDFFEVGESLPRLMIACAKLGTVAKNGGMLLGADFSEKWDTPQCVGKFTPLLVCKPPIPGDMSE